MERPSHTIFGISQRDENANVDGEAAVGIGVEIKDYFDGATTEPFGGHDGLTFRVIATSNTRKGIEYNFFNVPVSPYWVEATNPTQITGDDSGAWIDIPFGVTFYGGPGAQNSSGVYNRVWVSSNGFLSFDCDSNSPTPTPIPYYTPPNTLIAPYWSDLDPAGGSITYYGDLTKFVVEWENVLNKHNGMRQTFEVVILNDHIPNFRGQNRIFLLYQTVTWPEQGSGSEVTPSGIPPPPSFDVAQGIEDQEGEKGTLSPYVDSGYGIQFTSEPFSSPEIRELNILMNKADSHAQVFVDRNPWSVRGHNIQWDIPEPDPNDPPLLATAVCGGATLLMTAAFAHYFGPVAGLMWGFTRLTMELGYEYAKHLRQVQPIAIYDSHVNPETDFCYLNASAATYSPPYDYPVDASVGAQVFWVLLDDSNLDHELTLTAQLKYYSDIQQEVITLETSVTLRTYIGTPSIPAQPDGPTSGEVEAAHVYNTSTTTPDGDSIYYEFDWNDGPTTMIGPYPSGIYVSASHIWNTAGTYYVKVRAKDSSYEMWSDWSSSLEVSISNSTGGGGGGGDMKECAWSPTLFVWNGSEYVKEVTLHLHGESDVIVWHTIEQTIMPEKNHYLLSLRELNESTSHIDYVRLYVTDTEGQIHECHLSRAVHNEFRNVKRLLESDDDNRVDLGPSQSIDMKFNEVEIENTAYFILEIQGYEPD
jgi:hypothetical protein